MKSVGVQGMSTKVFSEWYTLYSFVPQCVREAFWENNEENTPMHSTSSVQGKTSHTGVSLGIPTKWKYFGH